MRLTLASALTLSFYAWPAFGNSDAGWDVRKNCNFSASSQEYANCTPSVTAIPLPSIDANVVGVLHELSIDYVFSCKKEVSFSGGMTARLNLEIDGSSYPYDLTKSKDPNAQHFKVILDKRVKNASLEVSVDPRNSYFGFCAVQILATNFDVNLPTFFAYTDRLLAEAEFLTLVKSTMLPSSEQSSRNDLILSLKRSVEIRTKRRELACAQKSRIVKDIWSRGAGQISELDRSTLKHAVGQVAPIDFDANSSLCDRADQESLLGGDVKSLQEEIFFLRDLQAQLDVSESAPGTVATTLATTIDRRLEQVAADHKHLVKFLKEYLTSRSQYLPEMQRALSAFESLHLP